MRDGYIEGLQVGIDMCEPAVKAYVEELSAQQRAGAAGTVTAHLRGAMRAYAEVVGGLKLKIEVAKGGTANTRLKQHKLYLQQSKVADAIQNLFEGETTPHLKQTLFEAWEAAERQADAMVVRFALE